MTSAIRLVVLLLGRPNGVWRHVVRRVPLRYHPSYRALVFPLGRYSAATLRMRAAIALESFEWLPQISLGVALVAWAATAAGLVHAGGVAATAKR